MNLIENIDFFLNKNQQFITEEHFGQPDKNIKIDLKSIRKKIVHYQFKEEERNHLMFLINSFQVQIEKYQCKK